MSKVDLNKIPLIALKNKVLFPKEIISLVFEREESLNALNFSLDNNIDPVFVFQKKYKDEIEAENLYNVGTVAKIIRIWKMPEGPTGVLVEGLYPVEVSEIEKKDNTFFSEFKFLENKPIENLVEIEAVIRNIILVFKDILNMGVSISLPVVNEIIGDKIEANELASLISSILTIKNEEKQALLAETDLLEKLKKINLYINKEKEILKLGQKVQQETQKKVGKFAREAMLREQMKTIEKELGMSQEDSEFGELRNKLKKAKLSVIFYYEINLEKNFCTFYLL